jgi:hypothetical protein
MTAGFASRALIGLALVTSLVLPASALAKGGGGGGGSTTPTPPTVAPVQCDWTLDGPVTGGTTFSNQVGDAGCVTALATDAGTTRLYAVAATPGWTWTSSTTTDGFKISFVNTATGARAEARIEPGKTDIRG